MADLKDLLNYSHEQKPIEFQSAIADLLAAKAAEAVASRKQQLAMSLFGDSEQSNDTNSADILDIDNDNDQDEINNDNDPDNQDENSEE